MTGIQIHSGGLVDSVRLQINGEWQRKAGGRGGGRHTLILRENEYINRVEIQSGGMVDRLIFHTSLGRSMRGGGDGARRHQEGGDGNILVGCVCRAGTYLDQIQFLWK